MGITMVSGFECIERTHFPSTTSNLSSAIGKQPHPTTLSVATTSPLNRNNSNTKTIPGRMPGFEGSTVYTF